MFVNPKNKEIADFRLKIIEQCNSTGHLTATDGALVMNSERYVFCFGGKIRAINALAGSTKNQVVRPIEHDIKSHRIFAEFGGTLHQSAVQSVHDQPDSIAIVAS